MEGRGSAAGLVEVWRRSAGLVEVRRGTAAGLVEVWRRSAAGLVEVWWGTAKVLCPSLMVPIKTKFSDIILKRPQGHLKYQKKALKGS